MAGVNDNVEIKVFASGRKHRFYDEQSEGKVAEAVRHHVLDQAQVPYHSVKVKINHREDGSPRSLVAYMLRRDTYTADVVKLDVNENYEVQTVEADYADTDEYEDEDEDDAARDAVATWESYDFVAGTPVPEIPTAKEAIERVCQIATAAGFKTKMLLGPEATVAAYKHYLSSGIRGFVNVGHGYPGGIVLDDGRLQSGWFQSLSGRPLSPAVVYFNSCQVHNDPLLAGIMQAGARTYVGGIVNLQIGPSEKVCKCFWQKTMTASVQMKPALDTCEHDLYPHTGHHGISGDLGHMLFVTSPIDKYKVVLYGKDATGGDLVAFIHCYHNNQNVMSCEFYKDDAPLPENRNKGGRVGLVYPWARFSAVLDVLRNEKPVYFGFIESTKVGYVSTQQEPVGEGDDET